MTDYPSRYSGPQIDEAVGRSFKIDMSTNGWVKLKSSAEDPYNLDYLLSMGNYTVFYFENGTAEMNAVLPLKISVLVFNDILTQIVVAMDMIQSRQYIDEEWTAWESWYSTGYIYQQPDAPTSPMKNALWIDTSNVLLPVFHVFDGVNWREVRPTDAMDKSVYDPQGKATDVFAYIDEMIKNLNQMPDGENTYADAFAVHIADNTIHLTGKEKKDLMDRPTKEELEKRVQDINSEMMKDLGNTSSNVLAQATEIIQKIEKEAGDIRSHIDDSSIHVDSTQVASWDNKAEKDHDHILDGKVKLDCSALISGTIPLDKIPPLAIETLTKVQTKEDMYKLTIDDVQNGDTIYVVNDRNFYYVVNDKDLTNPDSFMWYAATLPVSMPWDQVVDKPTTRDGYGLTDVYTMDETDRLIFDSDADTTDYLTNVFSRSKQMYTGRWYYKNTINPDELVVVNDPEYSNMRVMGKDGYIYYLTHVLTTEENEVHALMRLKPFEASMNANEIDYTIPAKDAIASELVHNLSAFSVQNTFLCEIDSARAIKNFYDATTWAVDASFDELSQLTISDDYTHVYSTKDEKLYKVNIDEATKAKILTDALTNEIGMAMYITSTEGYQLSGIDHHNPMDFIRIYAENLGNDMKFDGVFVGMENEDGDYTGAFVLHSRSSLYFYPAIEGAEDQIREINFGKDYIIADSIERLGKVVVLLIHADDIQSVQNEAWKAYQLHMYVAIIDPKTYTYVMKDVHLIEDAHEVGSSDEDDYLATLDNIYNSLIYKDYPCGKGFRMIFSNNAVIIYYTGTPLISLNLTTWTAMTTQWIDYLSGVVTPIEIHAEDLRVFSCDSNDAILITRMNGDVREWAFTVDNYNYFSFKTGYCWDQYLNESESQFFGYTTSLASNINGIYILSTPLYHGVNNHGFETLQFKLNSVTNSIDEAMKEINKTIEEETGIPTTKTEFYEFNQLMRAPVDLTNGDAGYYSIFVDTAVPNPKSWHYIHYVNGDIEEDIPPISNLPSTSSVYYIKGGYMYNNALHLILHLVHDDGTISITIATVLSDSIVIISPTTAKPTYIDSTDVQHLRYRIYKKNDIAYAYPNFTHAYSGVLINNLPIIRIDCATADFAIGIRNVPGTYHSSKSKPDIQWMGVLHDRVFLFRTKRSLGMSRSMEITYWENEDFTLSGDPTIILEDRPDFWIPDCYANPFAPFVVKDKILFAVNNFKSKGFTTVNTLLQFYIIDLNTGQYGLSDKISIELPYIDISGNDMSSSTDLYTMYQGIFDEESKTIYAVMKNPSRRIYVYRLVDENALDTDAFIRVGEISEASLKTLAYGNEFVFDDILPLRVNHTFMIMNTSPNLDKDDSREGIFKGTPIISFMRDNGAEIYKKSYVLAAQYTKALKKYDEKFKVISENIAMARKYTNAILRILG